jgi:hypothetical protein
MFLYIKVYEMVRSNTYINADLRAMPADPLKGVDCYTPGAGASVPLCWSFVITLKVASTTLLKVFPAWSE